MKHGDTNGLQVLSLIPGRMRLHLEVWTGTQPDAIEACLRQLRGVEAVQANPVTGNVLIHFRPQATNLAAIVPALHHFFPAEKLAGGRLDTEAVPDSASDSTSRLGKVAVRGIVGHACVDSVYFGAGFLGRSLGLPLMGWLGPLHLLFDIAVWSAALASVRKPSPAKLEGTRAHLAPGATVNGSSPPPQAAGMGNADLGPTFARSSSPDWNLRSAPGDNRADHLSVS
jgi:hypothetical protein